MNSDVVALSVKTIRSKLPHPGAVADVRILFVALALLASAIGITLFSTTIAAIPEGWTVDARFAIRGKQKLPSDIVVVGIDKKYLSSPIYGALYPAFAKDHADVILKILASGAKLLVYDLQDAQTGQGSELNDLIVAIERGGPRLLMASSSSSNGVPPLVGHAIPNTGWRLASPILVADPGGEIRHLPYQVNSRPSLAVVAAQMATGKLPARSQFHGKGAWIDYHDTKTLSYISYLDVINADTLLPIFQNKIVVVGTFAPTLGDVYPTPVGQMAGANIIGEGISTILRNFPLRDSPGFVGILLVLAFAVVPPVGGLRLKSGWGFSAAILIAVLYLIAAQLLFLAGYIIPVIAPLVALLFAAVGTLFITGLAEGYERRRVRDVFSRFVDERVVSQVLEQAGEKLRLGGQSRECTVLFSDLRGFTTYSEGRSPEAVLEILNAYTEEMSQAILEHEGTLLAYLGDGILALFGAPLEQPDHHDRAVATARDMIKRLDKFNKDQQAKGNDVNFRMGIGINTGPVMVGNVGSERRLEYTAIGDAVNTASRIEGLTKGTAHQIYLSHSTYEGLTHKPQDLEHIGELDIRGRTTGVKIWGVREDQTQNNQEKSG